MTALVQSEIRLLVAEADHEDVRQEAYIDAARACAACGEAEMERTLRAKAAASQARGRDLLVKARALGWTQSQDGL
jgi:hypothetical protein